MIKINPIVHKMPDNSYVPGASVDLDGFVNNYLVDEPYRSKRKARRAAESMMIELGKQILDSGREIILTVGDEPYYKIVPPESK